MALYRPNFQRHARTGRTPQSRRVDRPRPVRVPDAFALRAALVRLDRRLVPGHELACPKAGDEAQVFVGVDEHRGARPQGRGRFVQEKRQRLAAAGPVLQEVVREHAVAFRPQAARLGMRRGRALADVGKGGVEQLFVD